MTSVFSCMMNLFEYNETEIVDVYARNNSRVSYIYLFPGNPLSFYLQFCLFINFPILFGTDKFLSLPTNGVYVKNYVRLKIVT